MGRALRPAGNPDSPEVIAAGDRGRPWREWYRDCAAALSDPAGDRPGRAVLEPSGRGRDETMFWFRRQAHEVGGAPLGSRGRAGRDLGYPAELAVDGVDEVATLFFPRQVRLQRITPLTRSLAVAVADGPTWVLHGNGIGGPTGTVDAAVTGPADALVLLLWGRVGLQDRRLTVTGSREAAATVLGAGLVP